MNDLELQSKIEKYIQVEMLPSYELNEIDSIVEMLKYNLIFFNKIPENKRYFFFEKLMASSPEVLIRYPHSPATFKKLAEEYIKNNPETLNNPLYAVRSLWGYSLFNPVFINTEEGRNCAIENCILAGNLYGVDLNLLKIILSKTIADEVISKIYSSYNMGIFMMFMNCEELIKIFELYPNIFFRGSDTEMLNKEFLNKWLSLCDIKISDKILCNKIKLKILSSIEKYIYEKMENYKIPGTIKEKIFNKLINMDYSNRNEIEVFEDESYMINGITSSIANSSIENENIFNTINKIINSKIVESKSIEVDEIIDYIDNPEPTKFRDLVGKAYGNDAKAFLEKNNYDISDIETLKILEVSLYEDFSRILGISMEKFLYMYTFYNMSSFQEFLRICSNKTLKSQFLLFLETFMINEEFYRKDLVSFNYAVKNFNVCANLFKNYHFDKLTGENLKTLKIIYNDLNRKVINDIEINDIQGLNNYVVNKKEDYKKKSGDLYQMIFSWFFSINYTRSVTSYSIDEFDAETFFYGLNIEGLLEDKKEKIINEVGLTEVEYNVIVLFNSIMKCDKENELKEIYEKLDKENFYFDLKPVFQKIKDYYCKDLSNSQFKLPNIAPKEEEKILLKEGLNVTSQNGVTIYNFEGADFDIICHVHGLNLQYHNKNNLLYDKIWDNWNNTKDGSNYISCMVTNKELLPYIYIMLKQNSERDNIIFGFTPNPDEIIGYGNADIGTNGSKMSANTTSSTVFRPYKENTKNTVDRIDKENLEGYLYSEVAINRYETQFSEDFLSLRQPDFIVSLHKNGPSEAELFLAKQFDIPIVRIDLNYYLTINNKIIR